MTINTHRRPARRPAPKPVATPDPPEIQQARQLPMFGPGIPIKIPLYLLPAYMQIYHLESKGYRVSSAILLVKRVPKEKS